ncbi:MAG: dihydropteroate synthase [Chlorobi bacterium]|nr:dihydropteroate synthase [Chlorobiota bacterium]
MKVHPFEPFSLNLRGKPFFVKKPIIMGILNVTPDSFYDGGRYTDIKKIIERARQLLKEGTAIIDLGAESTRPGATPVSSDQELERLLPAIREIKKNFPEAIISVDTYKPEVAEEAIKEGVQIINDISGGLYDKRIYDIAAKYKTPYILMHFKGNPPVMDRNPQYDNVVLEVIQQLQRLMREAVDAGVHDIILDPGFGFGKTPDHNYEILLNLELLHRLGKPILVGLSRKSMIWRVANTTPQEALPGTSALNLIALMKGAAILRVHDPNPANQIIKIYSKIKQISQ